MGVAETFQIPVDPALWKLDRFEDFIAERKKLLRERFKSLLVVPVTNFVITQTQQGSADLLGQGETGRSVKNINFAGDPQALKPKFLS